MTKETIQWIFFIGALIWFALIIFGIWLAIRIGNKYGNLLDESTYAPKPEEDYETTFAQWRREAKAGKHTLTFQAWRKQRNGICGNRIIIIWIICNSK